MSSPIPAMTDPLGKYWKQPNPDAILVDATHALMTEQEFSALSEYSSTKPSGVYPGKMWKRHEGIFHSKDPKDHVWMLCWYGIVEGNPDVCSIDFRKILVAK